MASDGDTIAPGAEHPLRFLGHDTPDPGKHTGLVTDVTVAKPNQSPNLGCQLQHHGSLRGLRPDYGIGSP